MNCDVCNGWQINLERNKDKYVRCNDCDINLCVSCNYRHRCGQSDYVCERCHGTGEVQKIRTGFIGFSIDSLLDSPTPCPLCAIRKTHQSQQEAQNEQ